MEQQEIDEAYGFCQLCPRMCGVDRHETIGYCRCGAGIKAARAALHLWEEPCISGIRGSGTVFFSGCALGCCYCQNHAISRENKGREISPAQLARIFLRLQEQGAHNINLVTATQYLPSVKAALDLSLPWLKIPVVYNCSGYERLETLEALKDYVDVWLPDLKYFSPSMSARYSQAPDYFHVASKAILKMVQLAGPPVFAMEQGHPVMAKGVLLRHMVLPGGKEDSIQLLHWIKENLPKGQCRISLLSQYTPCHQNLQYPEINRRVTSYEYGRVVKAALALGLDQGYMQEKSSAKEEYTPPFDLTGIET